MKLQFALIFLGASLLISVIASAQDTPSGVFLSGDSTWDGTYRRFNVPVLTYRYVSQVPPDADDERRQNTISPEMFRQHVEMLFYQGYTPISLYALHDALMTGAALPAKPVVLTFDGSYSDHYAHVFPTLARRGFIGTFFVITGLADSNDPRHMNWEQITELSNAGMHIESMSKTYPDLRGRDHDYLVYELIGSSESIFAYTGRMPRMFAYPHGVYDANVLAVLRSMGVLRAVTNESGVIQATDNQLMLQRLAITSRIGVAELERLLDR